jgi:L-malate glycosyltransferase
MPSESKPHILLVNVSPYVFGAEKSLSELVRLLNAEKRFRFTVLSAGGDTEALLLDAGAEAAIRLPFRIARKGRGLFGNIAQLAALTRGWLSVARVVRRLRPSVVHANGMQAMLAIGPIPWLFRIPVVWHIRDLDRPEWAVRWCSRWAKVVFAPSEAAAEQARRAGRRVEIVPNPVLSGDSPVPITAETPRAPTAFRIGVVGQLIPRKGQDIVLAALPRIIEAVPSVEVVLVGGNPFDSESDYVRELHRQVDESPLLHKHISLCPYNSAILSLYSTLSAIVIPSRGEAFGRVALEAMRTGCPVIAADTAGLTETIRHRENGLLFRVGDADDLACRVIELAASNGLRQHLIDDGHLTWAEHEKCATLGASRIAQVYATLARRG